MSLRGKFLPLLKTARCRSVTGLTAFSVFHSSPSSPLPHKISCRFFDIYQFANKEAIQKERARLGDELNRGYFADISELRKHGGKVGFANKTLIPTIAAKRFPPLIVEFADGRKHSLPLNVGNPNDHVENSDRTVNLHATLLCLSFRANTQAMIDSWTLPFLETFKTKSNVQLYEISFIDSWLLSLNPIKRLLLRTMRKSETSDGYQGLQRNIVYAFGDHYDLRKELSISNLLTGYIFLLDSKGRIRWQGFGIASNDELSSMLSCASWLLEEQCK